MIRKKIIIKATPYSKFPFFALAKRFLSLTSPALIVGYLLVGGFAANDIFIENPKLVQRNDRLVVNEFRSTLVLAKLHYSLFWLDLTQPPQGCGGDQAHSEFRQKQCDDFWGRMMVRGALAALPLILWIFLTSVGVLFSKSRYLLADQLLKKSQTQVGRVTQPPEAEGDFFSWLMEFQCVGVKVGSEQVKVYLPTNEPIPLAGESFSVLPLGASEHVFVGVLHAPHMVVVQGVEQ